MSRSGGSRVQRAPARKPAQRPKKRRPLANRVFWGFYKGLVVLSAIIVAVFIGVQLMIRPPEQTQTEIPVPNGGQTGDLSGSVGTDTSQAPGLERREKVYNVLLAGTDKDGTRTDTMMVMSYDVVNQTVGVISIPRDTLIDRGPGKNPKLVYGSGGVTQRVKDISDMLGVPIDYYIKVDLNGFIALVDYVEGVDFYVPCNMSYDDPAQDLSIHYTKGEYHLSGQQAMEVARFRKNNDGSGYTDVGRTQTQQALLVALAKKVLSWNNLTRINGFVEIFNTYVDTDLSLGNMLYFASQAIYLDTSTGVETFTLQGDGETTFRGNTYCYELDPETTLDAVNRLINPYTRDLTLEDMNLTQAG